MNKSMLLISSTWGQKKTFKMIPVSLDCPFNEVIFDPDSKVLALVGKEKKASLHMLPKLDENGDPMKAKRREGNNPNPYAQQRMTIDTYYEYFIESLDEIKSFIQGFSVNAESFEYDSFLKEAFQPEDVVTSA